MKLVTTFAALTALATSASAQAITFTGDAALDFATAPVIMPDPGGADVGMPPLLSNNTSGWDMDNIVLSYDAVSDTMFVGLDTFGIAGDADGDGDPSNTSAELTSSGGVDQPNLQGTEGFTFGFDLNNDGNLDVIAGLAFGSDFSGYQVAEFQGSIFSTMSAFGTPLPQNTGILFANPSAAAPDLEFTITNFSFLMDTYGAPQQDVIGVHAFMGSLEDDGIGEDFFPGLVTQLIPTDDFRCLPVENLYTIIDFSPVVGGDMLTTGYGIPEFYGCCAMVAGSLQPTPMPLPMLPGTPVLLVGLPDISDMIVVDLGVPPSSGGPIQCKETTWFLDNTITSGTTFYAQTIAYPGPLAAAGSPWLLSNVLTVTKP
jgi:hypothetical protein